MDDQATTASGAGPPLDPDAAGQPFVWLTTIGRLTGTPRTVELWFVLEGRTVYFLAGGGEEAHWVRNAMADTRVTVRVGRSELPGLARTPERGGPEDARARRSMAAKYQGWREGRPLSGWAREARCLAVDLS